MVLIEVREHGLTLSALTLYEELAAKYDLPFETDSLRSILKKSLLKSDAIQPNAAGYRVSAEDI